jgi:hypothetical protein
MLDIGGGAVLALWNGVEASQTQEYNAWHTREHVAERISVPGMIGARRYVKSGGPLPDYLTLYAMNDTDVLRSDAYRSLLENPTAWSRAMRPHFHSFMRLCCRRLLSIGGGLGGALAAIVVDDATDLRSEALRKGLESLLQEPGILAAHVLERDRDVPDVPFKIGGATPDFPTAGAIFLEGYDEKTLHLLLPAIRAALAGIGAGEIEKTLTTYTLAYALDRASLQRVVTLAPRAQAT